MVAIRLARAAFKKYHIRCFWPYATDLPITADKIDWVVEQLRRNGNGAAWQAAHRIHLLMQCP